MGRKKSKVQRLPPSERTIIGSKVIIFDPLAALASNSPISPGSQNVPTTLRIAEAAAAPWESISNIQLNPRGARIRVQLDDDTLRRILLKAGPLATLAASRVCRRWRRVALDILRETAHVDLSAATRRSVVSDLSYRSVLRTALSFPNMSRVSLSNFPHTDVLPSIAGFVMERLQSTTLREADFSGLEFSGADIVALLEGCPALTALQLVQTRSVTSSLLQTLVGALGGSARRAPRVMDFVDVSDCDGVNDEGLAQLLTRGRVIEVKAAFCRNARGIGMADTGALTVKTLNMHGCKNLTSFVYHGGALENLNLSQCPSLILLNLRNLQVDTPLELRALNLASCARLREVSFGRREGETGIYEYGGTEPPFALVKLEELLLSGVRSLNAAYISKAFGLSRPICVMPKLRRLEVIGCQIEELRLRAYRELERVDCSGCSHLNVFEISESMKIMSVNLRSRRSPMTRVHITIPSKATILGLRKSWVWQCVDLVQMITYGT